MRAFLWVLAILLCVQGAGRPLAAQQVEVAPPERTITMLVLLSGSADNSLENDFLAGFSSRLRQIDGAVVSLHVEFLDLLRASDRDMAMADWRARLGKKYGAIPLDAIVVHRKDALALVMSTSMLSADMALVHAGISEADLKGVALPPQSVGIPAFWDIDGTVRLAARLFPRTSQIAIVAGSTPREGELVVQARQAILMSLPTAEIIDLRGLGWPELEARLRSLPADTVILGLSMALDPRGRVIDQMQALKRGTEIANAPVFTLSPISVGMGSVGGSILDLRAVGADAAQRMLEKLQVDTAALPPLVPPPFTMVKVDARVLKRWAVPESRLPDGAEILFRPPSLWRDFPVQVGLSIFALTLLGGLALWLAIERGQRRRAETAAKSRLAVIARMNRVSAMGQLSASIAHEVNQPLGAVLNYAEGAERLLSVVPLPQEKLREALTEIRSESQRASDRIVRMRTLFTAAERAFEAVDLNVILSETAALAQAEAERRGIDLQARIASTPLNVDGDSVQLQQALLNLILNALDACADRTGGRVIVRADREGMLATLRIADNGCGIAPDQRTRIFDAFYTTKGSGMGLGLAIVQSIIELHGGRIGVLPGGEPGTCIQMSIPLARHPGPVPQVMPVAIGAGR